MSTSSLDDMKPPYTTGQRLYCAKCHAEIEIISPCACDPPDQVLTCCGEPMRPNTGTQTHLNVVD